MNNFFLNAYNLNSSLRTKEMINESIFGNLGLDKSLDAAIWQDFVMKSTEKLAEITSSTYYKIADNETTYSLTSLDQKEHLEYWVGKIIYRGDIQAAAKVPDVDFFSTHQDNIIEDLYKASKIDVFIVSPETIGSDPVDFSKLPIKFETPPSVWTVTPTIVICNFKNLRSLKGFINLKDVRLCIWNCPKLTSLAGVKVKEISTLVFFPDAVDGKTLGSPKYGIMDAGKDLHIIFKNTLYHKQFVSAQTILSNTKAAEQEKKELFKSKMDKAIERSNMKNQFDDNVKLGNPKTISKAAPIISNPSKTVADDLPVLYRKDNILYSKPDFIKKVAKISRNNISIYKIMSSGNVSANIWLKYNENDGIAYTLKGTAGYKIE